MKIKLIFLVLYKKMKNEKWRMGYRHVHLRKKKNDNSVLGKNQLTLTLLLKVLN